MAISLSLIQPAMPHTEKRVGRQKGKALPLTLDTYGPKYKLWWAEASLHAQRYFGNLKNSSYSLPWLGWSRLAKSPCISKDKQSQPWLLLGLETAKKVHGWYEESGNGKTTSVSLVPWKPYRGRHKSAVTWRHLTQRVILTYNISYKCLCVFHRAYSSHVAVAANCKCGSQWAAEWEPPSFSILSKSKKSWGYAGLPWNSISSRGCNRKKNNLLLSLCLTDHREQRDVVMGLIPDLRVWLSSRVKISWTQTTGL